MRVSHLGVIFSILVVGVTARAQTLEVIPKRVDVEAGGGSSQVLVRGVGADTIEQFNILSNGKPTSYLLARGAGKATGQITVVIHAREDTPRKQQYVLAAGRQVLPLQIRIVNPGEAKYTGRPNAPAQDIRETVREANTSQIVVSADQAPQVLRTVPAPLLVAPDGETKTVQLIGKRLETIDDVRVRKADKPPKYRGKQGKLPFSYREGVLEVELMASRNTELGEKYVLDLMIGKFKAVSVGFEIGEPTNVPQPVIAPVNEGPMVIELPDSASSSGGNDS